MTGGGIDQLTDREKRVLRLLVAGHSVKSAAAEEAITENAAHELLRSARRKLGTGSSREAARALAEHEDPQKIRDEKTVIPVSPADRRSRWRFNKRIAAMIVTALAASAAFMMLNTQGNGSSGSSEGAEGHRGNPAEGSHAPVGQGAAPAAAPLPAASAQAARVVRTAPADGAVIQPGPFQLSVTFDRPMAPGSYAFSHDAAEAPFPDCVNPPQLSSDGRTYTLECVAKPGGRHVIYLNRPPHIGFLDAQTRAPAQAARLAFTVAGEGQQAVAMAPKVVRTVPANGAAIAPGSFTVSVTFDRPMAPQSYSFVRSDEGAYPECAGQPRLSADGLTYSLDCAAQAPGTYVMYFNRPPYLAFRDRESGAPAEPARLEFAATRAYPDRRSATGSDGRPL